MKPRRVVSLRYGLPLLLTGVFGVLMVIMAWESHQNTHLQLETSSYNFLVRDMASLRLEIEAAFSADRQKEVVQHLAIRGVDQHFRALAVLDEQGRILFATRILGKGQAGAKVLPEFDSKRFAELQRTQQADVRSEAGVNSITAYFPLTLTRNSGATRPPRNGALFVLYDLKTEHAMLWTRVWQTHRLSWLLLLMTLLALQYCLQRFVNLPIKQLVTVAASLARGATGVRSNFIGGGEIARLGQAFNDMSAELEARTKQRQSVEAALIDSEEKYRSVFQSTTPGMIVVADDQGIIRDWSPGAERALGYSKAEAVGRPLTLIMPQRYHEQHQRSLNLAREQGGLVHSGTISAELYGLRKNGQEFPLTLSLGSWHSGEKLYFSAMIIDLTQHKQMEQILCRSEKMASIGQLSGGIAHDFNNLLGIILGNLTLLRPRLAQDGMASKQLAAIEKSAHRAADLTRQLLSFAARQAGRVAVTDIGQLLRQSKGLIARSVTAGIVIETDIAEDLYWVELDPGELEDALLNLTFNARDAMPSGGRLMLTAHNITLDAGDCCAAHAEASAGEYLQLSVGDTGRGITPELQERIFDPFFTTKVEGQGTGLGLAMVFGFVQRCGGFIEVDSTPGVGSTFRLYLPKAQGTAESIAAHPEVISSPPGGHETILIVDDEPDLLELTRESLSGLGYRVLAASDSRQALQWLSDESEVRLLFSDVVLKDSLNGDELAKQARVLDPRLKVLLTSGYSKKAVAQGTVADLEFDLLVKPYSLDDLARRLRSLLDQSPAGLEARRAQHGATPTPVTPLIEWTDAMSVGVETLDSDHRILIKMINQCTQRLASGAPPVGLSAALAELQAHTQSHCRREEVVMAACAYPGLANHRQVHRMLLQQLEMMCSQLQRGELGAAELVVFLHDSLAAHLQDMDQAFAPYCVGKDKAIAKALAQQGSAGVTLGSSRNGASS